MLWLFVILAFILLWAIPAFRTLQEMEGQPAPRWRIPFLHLIDEPEEAAIVFVLLGIGIAVGGYAFLYGLGTLRDIVGDFYANIAAEAISIAITVLIIERLYERRSKAEAEKAEKERLILQMGSPDNGFAVEAVRQLEKRGGLTDGSLRGVDISGANLSGAALVKADLGSVKLFGGNLSRAILWDANFRRAILNGTNLTKAECWGWQFHKASLWRTDLTEAVLWGADLREANLMEANLSGADLAGANLAGAQYTNGLNFLHDTCWPKDFDPRAAGAVEVKWDEQSKKLVPID